MWRSRFAPFHWWKGSHDLTRSDKLINTLQCVPSPALPVYSFVSTTVPCECTSLLPCESPTLFSFRSTDALFLRKNCSLQELETRRSCRDTGLFGPWSSLTWVLLILQGSCIQILTWYNPSITAEAIWKPSRPKWWIVLSSHYASSWVSFPCFSRGCW